MGGDGVFDLCVHRGGAERTKDGRSRLPFALELKAEVRKPPFGARRAVG